MDLTEIQLRVQRLIALAADGPTSEEGRTAGATACRLIREHGLLVVKPADLVTFVTAPPVPAPKKRKRRDAAAIAQAARTTADTVVSTVDAAGRIVESVNGFRDALRGSR